MSNIKKVVPQENYKLEVLLDNGCSIILNMESRLHTVRFCMLSDKEFFDNVITDGNYIRWDNKIEISVNEIFQLAQK